jgi:HEAT repeat protein
VLGQLGEVAGESRIVRLLIRLLDDNDYYVREAAARALGRIGSSAATSEVFGALAHAMEDTDPNVHEAAMESLVELRALRVLAPNNDPSSREHMAA